MTKILLVHDGTTPYVSQYGTVYTTQNLGTFSAGINAGQVFLTLTPNTANVVVRFTRTAMVV